MSSEDEFEIDMGGASSHQAEKGKQKEADLKKQEPQKVNKVTIPATHPSEETKNEFDDFEVEAVDNSKTIPQVSHQMQNMSLCEVQATLSDLPIPPQECENTYLLMNHLSIILNTNGSMTPLDNQSEVYSNSAGCPLYGMECQGYNFLIAGGCYYQLEEVENGKQLSAIRVLGMDDRFWDFGILSFLSVIRQILRFGRWNRGTFLKVLGIGVCEVG